MACQVSILLNVIPAVDNIYIHAHGFYRTYHPGVHLARVVGLYQPQILQSRTYLGLIAHTWPAVGKSSFELLRGNLFAALSISRFPRRSLSPSYHFLRCNVSSTEARIAYQLRKIDDIKPLTSPGCMDGKFIIV